MEEINRLPHDLIQPHTALASLSVADESLAAMGEGAFFPLPWSPFLSFAPFFAFPSGFPFPSEAAGEAAASASSPKPGARLSVKSAAK